MLEICIFLLKWIFRSTRILISNYTNGQKPLLWKLEIHFCYFLLSLRDTKRHWETFDIIMSVKFSSSEDYLICVLLSLFFNIFLSDIKVHRDEIWIKFRYLFIHFSNWFQQSLGKGWTVHDRTTYWDNQLFTLTPTIDLESDEPLKWGINHGASWETQGGHAESTWD